MRTVRIKINAHCVPKIQLCTRLLRILIPITSYLESINVIDMCTRLDKTIYSSNENSSKLVNNPVITCTLLLF